MMLMTSMEELNTYLADLQTRRETDVRCEINPALSARMNDAALLEVLVTGLPMAQGIQHRIIRSRGRGVILMAKIHYRQGVRMLDHWHSGKEPVFAAAEAFRLADACDLVMEAMRSGDAETRFCHVYNWVCRNIRYVHTAPGKKGYERLVGAADVLQDRRANCQGFADVMYLLCGLCGIPCEYRCGRGQRQLHVWNAVCLNGKWQDVDASKGARDLYP